MQMLYFLEGDFGNLSCANEHSCPYTVLLDGVDFIIECYNLLHMLCKNI